MFKTGKYLLLTTLSSLCLLTYANAEMVLRKGGGGEPKTLDPSMSSETVGSTILRDLFEGLVADGQGGEVVPGMAKSWDISEDGLTYTFYLRDAKWSNGEPVSADDFVYALRRGVDPVTASSQSDGLFPIVNAKSIVEGKEKDLSKLGVKALNAKTLVINLRAPTPYFLESLKDNITYPLPEKVIEQYGQQWTRPENIVSNGAFKMTKWVPNARIELVKSNNYWDKQAVKLDKVIYYNTEDRHAEFNRFRAGELDWSGVPTDKFDYAKKNYPEALKVGKMMGIYYYGFNITKPPFDNINLRKAFSYAIDRDLIVTKILKAGQQPAYNFVVPGTLNAKPYIPDYAKLTQQQRVAQAKKFYQAAGYSKDKPLTVELSYNTSEGHKKIAIAITSMLKQAFPGIKVNMINQEWKVFLSTIKQKKTELFRMGIVGSINDPFDLLGAIRSNRDFTNTGFSSLKVDELLEQSGFMQDKVKRAQLLYDAEKIFIDSFAIMPIYFYVSVHVVNPKLRGYTINIMNHNRAKYMYFEK